MGLLLVVVYPLVEILVAIWIAGLIGWGAVLALLLGGVVLGAMLMRWGGAGAVGALRQSARAGELPGGEVGDHALLFLGGLLIAIPGFVTDAVGLLLVFPPTRALVRKSAGVTVGRRLRAGGFTVVQSMGTGGSRVSRIVPGDVIPGEVVDPAPSADPGPPRTRDSGPGGLAGDGPPRQLPPAPQPPPRHDPPEQRRGGDGG